MDVDLHQLFTRAAVEGARHRSRSGRPAGAPFARSGIARCGLRRSATDWADPPRSRRRRPHRCGSVPASSAPSGRGSSGSSSAARRPRRPRPTCSPPAGTSARSTRSSSPAAAAAERAAGSVAKQLLGLPGPASVGFVTGAQAANTVGLAAGRQHVLADAGWDVEQRRPVRGAAGRVVASEERHATIDRSLRLLGLGTAQRRAGRADRAGRHRRRPTSREVLAAGSAGPTIVCLQAGNVNTGACDDLADGHRRWPTSTARGCTSTARSGCGRRPAPRTAAPRRRASSSPTPGACDAPQVAQRPLRLRPRVLRPTRRCMPPRCRTPRPTSPVRRRSDRVLRRPHARVLPTGTGIRGVGRAA